MGFDEFRWPLPVHPGDELHLESEVLEVRPSKSRPNRGLIKVRTTTRNQNGGGTGVGRESHRAASPRVGCGDVRLEHANIVAYKQTINRNLPAVRQRRRDNRSPLRRYPCHRPKRLTWRWPCLSDARATSSPWSSPTGIVANQYDWRLIQATHRQGTEATMSEQTPKEPAKTPRRCAWPQPPVLSYNCRDGRSYRRSRWARPHGTEPVRRSASIR